jgi:hypothetical protein
MLSERKPPNQTKDLTAGSVHKCGFTWADSFAASERSSCEPGSNSP